MATDTAVTTVVTRRVKADRRADYEAWLERLLADASSLDGYLGTEVVRPPEGDPSPEYTSVFRFASIEQLRAFERSDLRRRHLTDVVDLVEADAVWETTTGLEWWFSAPPGTVVAQPVRWRMAVVIGALVYLMVLVFGTIAATLLDGWPFPLRLLVVIAVEIALMTYVLLPWLTKRLARWIFPRSSAA